MLTITNLSKLIQYPYQNQSNSESESESLSILKPMNLQIKKQSIHALVGKNGAGKTTLLKTIAGLYSPTTGQLKFCDQVPKSSLVDEHKLKATTYFVPDTIGFSITETFKYLHDLHRLLYPHWDELQFQNYIKTLSFNIFKPLRHLSKGEERQLLMCFALASNPNLFILDEPFDGLDPLVHKEISRWLIDAVAAKGASIIISTHHLRDVEDFCDTITFIHRGALVLTGELDLILDAQHVIFCHRGTLALKALQESQLKEWSLLEQNPNEDSLSLTVPKIHLESALAILTSSDHSSTPLFYATAPITLDQLFMHCAKEL